MRRMSLLAAAVGTVVVSVSRADDPKPEAPPRVLPGMRKDGFVQLPNQWKLKPAGVHLELGDLPVNVQLHPTGQYAAVLHCGMKEHEVVVVSLGARKGI